MKKHNNKELHEIMEKIGTRGCFCHSNMEDDILKQLKTDKLEKDMFSGAIQIPSLVNQLVPFLCHIPLNSYTRDLQHKLYANLKKKFPKTLDEMIFKHKAHVLFYMFDDHKQRKKVDSLIAKKRKIKEENIPTVGEKKLDYHKYLKDFKVRLADKMVFRRRQFSMDD